MATSCTGFYILQPSTLRLKSSSCTTLSIARLCCARNAHLQNRSKNLYWKRPLLWEKVVSRRALTCNFFRQPVEEDKAADNDERNELEPERPPFDLNMAVVLAGFAFEAYTTPTEKVGVREIDAGECETVFLSEQFLHEVYDGQLLVKLKKGVNLPAMDPWGTSDPYVVMQLGDCVVKSKIIWAAKEPNWNENFKLNVKDPTTKYLQVAVWDANLITPHKRMGNGGVKLESLCDGNMYDIQVELEGIGGGGLVYLEVNYEAFEDIKAKKSGWWIPFLSDIVLAKGLESSLKRAFGTDSVRARDFVRSAFGQLQPLFDIAKFETNEESEGKSQSKMFSENILNESNETGLNEVSDMNYRIKSGSTSQKVETDEVKVGDERNSSKGERLSNLTEAAKDQRNDGNIWSSIVTESSISPDFDFWKILAENINRTVEKFGVNNIGFPALESVRWNGNEMIKKLGLQSQTLAEQQYVGSGLATPKQNMGDDHSILMTETQEPHSTTMDVKQVSYDVLRQTENILGSLMMITASLTGHKNDSRIADGEVGKGNTTAIVTDRLIESPNSGMVGYDSVAEPLTNGRQEEMKKMFASAESAMEAWAVLATALGRASFIKSEFEKICFLDNGRTDTQVAIWRDTSQQRLVIAFRGTEQVRWKDLRTDLMLAPAGLNPERMGGDFKEEVQVHSGFLNAYDSVRSRLLSFIKTSISFKEGEEGKTSKWHVYVTGHSLGGALATLLALELSSSQMAKSGRINVTMYNFGSPRVGNKRFAEAYNEKVKDSWRVVNHRDIIPSVPRLMGYCHVAQPVYLTAGDLQDASVDMEILADGYEGDIIGETTPDVIVSEFMKGEKQLIDKLLQTEINLFRAIRDGSALMQHMEDFYYITLLERVRSKYLRQ